jgi:hypothetical protein
MLADRDSMGSSKLGGRRKSTDPITLKTQVSLSLLKQELQAKKRHLALEKEATTQATHIHSTSSQSYNKLDTESGLVGTNDREHQGIVDLAINSKSATAARPRTAIHIREAKVNQHLFSEIKEISLSNRKVATYEKIKDLIQASDRQYLLTNCKEGPCIQSVPACSYSPCISPYETAIISPI